MADGLSKFTIDFDQLLGGKNPGGQQNVPMSGGTAAPTSQSQTQQTQTSAQQPAPNGGIGTFDEVLGVLQAEAARVGRINREQAAQVENVTEQVRESAQKYQGHAAEVANQIEEVKAGGDRARQLASSPNLLNRLELIGGQVMDPQKYTRAGRQGQMAEMNQVLALHGQVHNVNMTAAQARIAEIQAETAIKQAQGETAYDRLQTRLTALQTTAQAGQATEALRQQALTQQTLGTLQQATAKQPDQNGFYQIGDFLYGETEVLERQRNLHQRNMLAKLPMNAYTDDALAARQSLMLNTMDLPELQAIRDAGYQLDDEVVRRDLLDEQIAQRQQVQQQQFAQAIDEARVTSGQYDAEFRRATTKAEQLLDMHPPGTQRGNIARAYKNEVAAIAQLAEDPRAQGPEGKMTQLALLTQAEQKLTQQMEAQIQQEEREEKRRTEQAETAAERKAGGDKALVSILTQRELGNEVPASQVYSYVEERFTDGLNFARVMPTKDAAKLRSMAEAEFKRLIEQAETVDQFGGTSKVSVSERKTMRAQAMATAWESMQLQRGAAAVARAIPASLNPAVAESITVPGPNGTQRKVAPSPLLSADMTQGDWVQLENDAHNMTVRQLAARHELEGEAMQSILDGNYAAAEVGREKGEEIRTDYNFMLTMAQYDLLERRSPGLGNRYTRWLTKNLIPLSQRVLDSQDQTNGLFSGGVEQIGSDAIAMWSKADEGATQRTQFAATEQLLKLGEAETVLGAAVNMVDDLTNDQKAQVWSTFIQPTLDAAKQQRLNARDTMNLVTSALEQGIEGDPAMTQLGKKVVRAMPHVVRAVESTHQSVASRIFNQGWAGFAASPAGTSLLPTIGDAQDAASAPTIRSWRNQDLPWMPRGDAQ